EMAALNALLAHPNEARIHGEVVAGGTGAEDDHAAALHHEAGNRESRLAGMLEDEIDVIALAGDTPDRLAEFAALFHIGVIALDIVDIGELAPAVEIIAVDDALGAQRHDEIALALIRDDTDGVRAGGRNELDRHRAEAAGGAPDQHVMAGPQDMRAMAEEHAVGGGEGEGVAAALLPGQMAR